MNPISARIGVVARDGLDACVYEDRVPPKDKAPPPTKAKKQLPGEEYESAKPLPPLNEVVDELGSESQEPPVLNLPSPAPSPQPTTNDATPPDQTPEDAAPPPVG